MRTALLIGAGMVGGSVLTAAGAHAAILLTYLRKGSPIG